MAQGQPAYQCAVSCYSELLIGGALAQGSMLGVVAALPPRNIKALMEGQASTGVIAATANQPRVVSKSLYNPSTPWRNFHDLIPECLSDLWSSQR
ncbi:hypothetical protein ACTXT7_009627 [Hymenolepis weldensis]